MLQCPGSLYKFRLLRTLWSVFALPSLLLPLPPQLPIPFRWALKPSVCLRTISASISFSVFSILAADAKEKQFWVTQLRTCAKYHMETSPKVGD